MSSVFKRCRSPSSGKIDSWLDSLGYYRKNVAYDETCLFRCVSEQLYDIQSKHEHVRSECIKYGKKNYNQFKHLMKTKEDWFDYLERLKVHMVVCGHLEIELVSLTYNVNVIIFDAHDKLTHDIKRHNSNKTLYICKMKEDHYDVVYKKEEISTAGFCQSLVYNILYEDVFKMEDVASTVESMLHDRPCRYTTYAADKDSDEEKKVKDCIPGAIPAPFPFKVAKALDPNMYRNIEYDTWIEVRRGLRLGDWYYGDDNLTLGTCCILNYHGEEVKCYIQAIDKEEDCCTVYITKYAKRCSVSYSQLKPEDNAKPWPLPFRFSRNQTISPSCEKLDETPKITKKKKEKKVKHIEIVNSSKDSDGSPMDSITPPEYEPKTERPPTGSPTGWHPSPSELDEIEISWPPTPTTPHQSISNYGPTTLPPIVIPQPNVFLDSASSATYYNNFNPMGTWSAPKGDEFHCQSELNVGQQETQQQHPHIPPLIMPTVLATPIYEDTPNMQIPQTAAVPITSPLIPLMPTPQMEMYPFVYPMPPPGTPLFIPSPSTPQHNMFMSQPPLPLYSPTFDVQYISPPSYIYPPTPPATWYSPAQVFPPTQPGPSPFPF